MHHKFYLDNNFTEIEQINKLFSNGKEIKNYLSDKQLKCGYHIDCKALLIPVFLKKIILFI